MPEVNVECNLEDSSQCGEQKWQVVTVSFLPNEWENLAAFVLEDNPALRPKLSGDLRDRVAQVERNRAIPEYGADNTEAEPPNCLRELRLRSRLNINEAAAALGQNFDAAKVSRQERGSRKLSAEDIIAYAALYKVPTYRLFVNFSAALDAGEEDLSDVS
ncbi:MAG: helix-turn-helix domain-containing protein [Ignavibacteria bacterium]|jgi:hypothetical protein|nr:helix-turn-helix domain-containing protein [Ignavibacteria bacterium]